jgi:hypothetical protein
MPMWPQNSHKSNSLNDYLPSVLHTKTSSTAATSGWTRRFLHLLLTTMLMLFKVIYFKIPCSFKCTVHDRDPPLQFITAFIHSALSLKFWNHYSDRTALPFLSMTTHSRCVYAQYLDVHSFICWQIKTGPSDTQQCTCHISFTAI